MQEISAQAGLLVNDSLLKNPTVEIGVGQLTLVDEAGIAGFIYLVFRLGIWL